MPPPRERRPITLKAPITLGVTLIVLVVILGAVWVTGTLIGILRGQASPELYWVMLLAGSALLIAVLAGVIAYLALSVKAFNLNRRQSNFIDAVTHELKSPIASLKLYLQTMNRHSVSQDQAEAFHKIMLEDVERLDTLINHLLDAANVERGTVAEESRDFPLRRLLQQVGEATCLRYKLPPECVDVRCNDITMHAPPVQVEILFRNLIDNAVKYGGSPPRVRILTELVDARSKAKTKTKTKTQTKAKQDSSDRRQEPVWFGETSANDSVREVLVSVCDNGMGIPANLRRKVFGRFVRLGNELERSSPGTGLGLYLVRNVTHALGGRINIHDSSGVNFEEAASSESESSRPVSNGGQPNSELAETSVVEAVALVEDPSSASRGTRFDITLPNAWQTGHRTPEGNG